MRLATLILAAGGFVLGGVALGLVLFRDPLGAGMSRYRFSTPKDSLISELQIEQNKDLRANIEYHTVRTDPALREKLKTLEVRKEAEWKGNKILFIVYEEKGVKKYDTPAFEKDADSGFWFPKYLSSSEVERDDKDLADKMNAWRQQGDVKTPNTPPFVVKP